MISDDLNELMNADRFPVREWNKDRKVLTPEEEIEKAMTELDIEQVRINFLMTYHSGFLNGVKTIVAPLRLLDKKTRLKQLYFLEAVKERMGFETINIQAYTFLGAFRYVQGRWGSFPDTGPLYEMAITNNNLERVIGEFGGDIKLEQLLKDPTLITERADTHFATFLKDNQDLISI